jgi:phosphoribosylanthranilate isomerase
MRCIAQCRAAFPDDTSVDWLFDASSGRGIAPAAWPAHPGRRVGYAGGIKPDNVLDVIRAGVGAAGPYWIDMESGVRTDDRFDLTKCRQVCEAVYGGGA